MEQFLENINFKELKAQKLHLLNSITEFEKSEEHKEKADALTGILGLIDEIQDIAVDEFGYEESEVFNLNEEEFEPLDLAEGVETKWGTITMSHAMLDTDGTNLEDGIEIRLDGELIGEAVGYTSSTLESFETVDDVEKFVDKHCDF